MPPRETLLVLTLTLDDNFAMKQVLLHRVYLAGYSGYIMPRWLRVLLAGSELHRAWFLGSQGFFEEQGRRFGPANPYPGPGFDREFCE
ncbi:MAG: hypothetical protein ACNA7M_01020 [Roseovarius sp.]